MTCHDHPPGGTSAPASRGRASQEAAMGPAQGQPAAEAAIAPAAARRLRAETRRAHMPTEAKRETVAELRDELSRSRTLIVSEYRGLTVKEIAEIRRALAGKDVRYRVVKNRLMKIAAEDGAGEAVNPLMAGPSAIPFGT